MVNIISRSGWGARAPRSRQTTSWSQRQEVTLHYSTGSVNQTPYGIQGYHMNSNGWSDIGYNFLVDHQGNAYEGRGWTVVGAHAAPRNTQGIGICYIGSDNMTDAAKRTVIALYDEANRRAGRTLSRRGHRDINSTSCPGTNNHAWWKSSNFRDVAGGSSGGGSGGSPSGVWTVGEHKVPTGTPMLSKGSSGALVGHLQRCLMAWKPGSLPKHKDDRDFGDETRLAVRDFQSSNGLGVDGVYGPSSARKMRDLLTAKSGGVLGMTENRTFNDSTSEQTIPRAEWVEVRWEEGKYSLAFEGETFLAHVALRVSGLNKGDELQYRFTQVQPNPDGAPPNYTRARHLGIDSPVHDGGQLHVTGSWSGKVPNTRRIRVEVTHYSDAEDVKITDRKASVLYSK